LWVSGEAELTHVRVAGGEIVIAEGTPQALIRFRETSIVDRRVRVISPVTLCLAASVCF